MKFLILIAVACFSVSQLYGQRAEAEEEIRRLEQKEVQAILQKDSAVLMQLWDADYVVNSPDNMIYFAGKTTLDRPVMRRGRTSFTRVIEHVTIKGSFAFSMGSETVVPVDDLQRSGEIVKRRFTNIWEKQEGGWKLVGRHASIICSKN